MLNVAFKRKLGKAEHKGHHELKSLLSSWGEENESESNRCAIRERAIVVINEFENCFLECERVE